VVVAALIVGLAWLEVRRRRAAAAQR